MTAARDSQTRRGIYALFAVLVIICALGNFSQTAVNGMMLAMGAELGFEANVGQWLTTSYMLVMGITVVGAAFLAKSFSTRSIVCASIGVFFAGCALGALGTSFWVQLAGRILQAVSTGITLPLVQTFPAMRFPAGQKATALGIAGIAMGFAPNVGPILGGAAAEGPGWRVVFIGMAVICIALLVCLLAATPKEDAPHGNATLDGPSLALSALGFGLMLLGISNASSLGVGNATVWLCIALGAVFVTLFLVRQKRLRDPLIDLQIFKSKRFSWVLALQCAMLVSYMGITLIAPLYWQNACGGTATQAGLIFLPATILALILNPLSGFATDKLGARPVALTGGLLMTAGAIAMCFVSESSPLAWVMFAQTLRGAGMSCLMGPTMAYGLSQLGALTPDGSSFLALLRQVCASVGTAIMMLIVSCAAQMGGQAALPYQAAFVFSAAFALLMLLCIAMGIKTTEGEDA